MRLPTSTAYQAKLEDARALHEAMWFAFLKDDRMRFETHEGYRLQGTLHRFWNVRGFNLKIRSIDPITVEVWIERRLSRSTAA